MARILCRVAGGGKPLKGNAETGDVLAGKTFSNKQSNALTGSMPNNGALNITLTPSGNNSTSQAVAAGYYSGGTITANGSSSYSQGVSDADGRVNTSSASYNSGYANGKADADNRVNTSSASYSSGYNKGRADARLVLISRTSFGNYETKTINISSGILIWEGDAKKYDCFMKSKSSVSHLIDAYSKNCSETGNPISLKSATDTTVTFNGRYGTISAYQIQ